MSASSPIAVRPTIVLFLGAIVVLVAHAATFYPFFSDDALIAMRYADRLLHGEGLTFTDGERVEGYSNLLWVLACAGLGALGCDLVTAARALGVLCSAVAVAMLLALHPPRRGEPAWLAAVGPAAFVLAAPPAVWAIGGQEQPLVVALLGWAVVLVFRAGGDGAPMRRAWAAGIPFALLCWARSEGPLFVAAACAWLTLTSATPRLGIARAARLVALPVLAVVLQTWFRLVYYEDWVPNTAYVKVEVTSATVWAGFYGYLLKPLASHAGLLPLAFAGIAVTCTTGKPRRLAALLLALAVPWCVYLAAIGGDDQSGWRQHVPTLWLGAALAGCGARCLALGPRPRPRLLRVGVIALAATPLSQLFDAHVEAPRILRWPLAYAPLGRWLGSAFAEERPLLAVDAAGCLPFFSRLPCLDMLGLNDRHIARRDPAPGTPPIFGHQLGDSDYVLAREPDFVMFGPLPGGRLQMFFGGGSLQALPGFQEHYRLVRLEVDGCPERALAWLRAHGRMGVRRADAGVIAPAYLFGGFDIAEFASADGDQRIRALRSIQDPPVLMRGAGPHQAIGEVRAPGRHWLRRVSAPAGPLRAEPVPHDAPIRCGVVRGPAGETVDLWVERTADAPARFEAVRVVPDGR